MKIKNTDASANLKIIEIITKETTLTPGQELETDPNTTIVEIATETS
ncbi:unnamed protein product [marine sediment metagenome]|uniref:Uncharacterized protein n=1 Tax=marine sediment metagenome TaxID=412755 RepID=X1LK55_9ZZZZ